MADVVESHTIAERLVKLLANLMINTLCRDGKTSYWHNSFIKWPCWASHNVYATRHCNDYCCRGRGARKRIYFQLNESTDVQSVNEPVGVVRTGRWLFLPVPLDLGGEGQVRLVLMVL